MTSMRRIITCAAAGGLLAIGGAAQASSLTTTFSFPTSAGNFPAGVNTIALWAEDEGISASLNISDPADWGGEMANPHGADWSQATEHIDGSGTPLVNPSADIWEKESGGVPADSGNFFYQMTFGGITFGEAFTANFAFFADDSLLLAQTASMVTTAEGDLDWGETNLTGVWYTSDGDLVGNDGEANWHPTLTEAYDLAAIPTPAAAGAGLVLMGLLGMRRNRRERRLELSQS